MSSVVPYLHPESPHPNWKKKKKLLPYHLFVEDLLVNLKYDILLILVHHAVESTVKIPGLFYIIDRSFIAEVR